MKPRDREGRPMEKWEYQTRFFEARVSSDQIKSFVESTFNKKARRYSPEAMIPELNALGNEGWEIIHMEPVARVGGKEDVRLEDGGWSNTYFAVLKRRKPGSFVPVQGTLAEGLQTTGAIGSQAVQAEPSAPPIPKPSIPPEFD
ncbi:MAG: hypothetical protein KC546_15645 [Anaerolineae bacterium]|nr:hypothetical protein [Anaerolineae bacterium]